MSWLFKKSKKEKVSVLSRPDYFKDTPLEPVAAEETNDPKAEEKEESSMTYFDVIDDKMEREKARNKGKEKKKTQKEPLLSPEQPKNLKSSPQVVLSEEELETLREKAKQEEIERLMVKKIELEKVGLETEELGEVRGKIDEFFREKNIKEKEAYDRRRKGEEEDYKEFVLKKEKEELDKVIKRLNRIF
jgi:hypothetical protein